MIRIKVPATTANIGPGFDALGLALDIFQEIEVSHEAIGTATVSWIGEVQVPNDENYVIKAIDYAFSKYADSKFNNLSAVKDRPGYHVTMFPSQIPVSRGLGSSAAAIVCGLYAANFLLDYPFSKQDLLEMASALEGHPDNVAPAIFGNLVLSTASALKTHYAVIPFPEDLVLKVFVPDFKLSTALARGALPEKYDRKVCIANLSRVGLLVHALMSKDYENLSMALEDHIHEPYRYPLIEDGQLLKEAVKSTEAFGMFISGAGPTLIALLRKEDFTFDASLKMNDLPLKHHWESYTLAVNKSGAFYEPIK